MKLNNIDIEHFIDSELKSKGLRINLLTEYVMRERLNDIMTFENNIRLEYKDKYKIDIKDENYFLNPMDRKFSFSYFIDNENKEILSLSLVSVYNDKLHMHSMFTKSNSRNIGIGKLMYMKVCNNGYDKGLKQFEGYWPKNNNGSIILGLRIGMEIQSIRNGIEVFMIGDLLIIINNAYKLYIKDKS